MNLLEDQNRCDSQLTIYDDPQLESRISSYFDQIGIQIIDQVDKFKSLQDLKRKKTIDKIFSSNSS